MADLTPFELTGPLPSGTTVLEASAGTGKTFTIAALATRWVAETDLTLPELLVVTFTKAATAELRDRVRRRLVTTADALDRHLRGLEPMGDDELCAHLCDADDHQVRLRHRRLLRAVADVDVATISTIHGFCQHVLAGLGIGSDLDREAELVEDLTDIVDEVIDDLLVTTYLGAGAELPRIDRREVVKLARSAITNPTTRLVPTGMEEGSETGLRLHLALRVREEVERRARQRRLLSYDDLLTRLDATLRDPDRSAAARDALRARYRATLIDEFQDTDPVQWSIVQRAFTHDPELDGPTPDRGRALVLIGDPKQAIYAFRGADVHAYLTAAEAADQQHTLGTNWRSDAGLLRAFETLLDGASFGDRRIPFRSVAAAPGRDAPGLVGAPSDTPLRLRRLPRHPHLRVWKDKITSAQAREHIAADLAADVVALLDAKPHLEAEDRPLATRDIAVLVASHAHAQLVHDALRDAGVPAVLGGSQSVFATDAATAWLHLLDALERPASTRAARVLALTDWIGWTGDRIAAAAESDWDQLHEDVHRWARILRERGVATLLRTVLLQREVAPRLLATEGGERRLADLEHVGELLHTAMSDEQLGVAGLADWLRDRIDEAEREGAEERLRRLDTDAAAVQVLTVHVSKGLEFPVVYLPFLWTSWTDVRDLPVFHGEDGERRIDVGGGHDAYAEHEELAKAETRGEELRRLYVALTRARHQVVAWYAPSGMPEWSGLNRVLFNRDGDTIATDVEAPLLDDDDIAVRLEELASRSGGTIAVEEVPARLPTVRWSSRDTDDTPLDRARFSRRLDEAWRRTSYSALTRVDDDPARVGSEPSEPIKDDEADLAEVVPTGQVDDPLGLREIELPLGEMAAGARIGTFVHEVLEHVDFAHPDLDAELSRVVAERLARRRVPIDTGELVAGLRAVVETPLGPSAGGLRLRDLTRADRRDEMAFELPLDRARDGRPATVADLTGLLREHLPADDPLADYPDHVPAEVHGRPLRGFLGGFIDLTFRRTGTDGAPVFHVVDHKTNRLGVWGEPLTAWDYRPEALADAMIHGHYPIQALLYAVALHRLLRWRLPGYDPAVHLGAPHYLFLRGMTPDTTTGVFAWDLPSSLVTATSDLLHGGGDGR